MTEKLRSKEYKSALRTRLITRRGKEISRRDRIRERILEETKSSTTSGQWRKVSSNIRHGECGDVDLGCIPVLLVACMPVYVYLCMMSTSSCASHFAARQMHISADRFNPLSRIERRLL